ncbi:hypothetical protein FRC03_006442 [Tulasnella sp. 419]|nr:hypothetical protein FRC03_006442 [Tulasnella sp. 419]
MRSTRCRSFHTYPDTLSRPSVPQNKLFSVVYGTYFPHMSQRGEYYCMDRSRVLVWTTDRSRERFMLQALPSLPWADPRPLCRVIVLLLVMRDALCCLPYTGVIKRIHQFGLVSQIGILHDQGVLGALRFFISIHFITVSQPEKFTSSIVADLMRAPIVAKPVAWCRLNSFHAAKARRTDLWRIRFPGRRGTLRLDPLQDKTLSIRYLLIPSTWSSSSYSSDDPGIRYLV